MRPSEVWQVGDSHFAAKVGVTLIKAFVAPGSRITDASRRVAKASATRA
jgi:hypothetical protein